MKKVQFTDVEEPNFIRKFKKRVNFVEPTKIEEKFSYVEPCSKHDDEYIKDDELPVVIMEDETVLDETVARELFTDKKLDTNKPEKILFKKPKSTITNTIDIYKESKLSTKTAKNAGKVSSSNNHKYVSKSKQKAIKNTKLLSFNDDE